MMERIDNQCQGDRKTGDFMCFNVFPIICVSIPDPFLKSKISNYLLDVNVNKSKTEYIQAGLINPTYNLYLS